MGLASCLRSRRGFGLAVLCCALLPGCGSPNTGKVATGSSGGAAPSRTTSVTSPSGPAQSSSITGEVPGNVLAALRGSVVVLPGMVKKSDVSLATLAALLGQTVPPGYVGVSVDIYFATGTLEPTVPGIPPGMQAPTSIATVSSVVVAVRSDTGEVIFGATTPLNLDETLPVVASFAIPAP